MKRIFAYARVSSQEQADRDLSIPAQLRTIRRFAAEQGLEIVQEFVDVESAKEPGRTNFTAMLAQLKRRPDVTGVLSHKLDRLLRNLRDYGEVDDLMKEGKEFHFVTESFDHNASGKMVLGMRVVFAKFYLDNLSEETKKGLNERVLERGKWAFVAPLGYLNSNGEIKLDPDRAPLIRKGFELYATGDWSVSELADYLYIEGLRTRPMRRSESGRFVDSRVHAMLRNPFYCGLMRYKGKVIRGAHEPLVDKALFDQVQVIMNRWEKKPKAQQMWFTYRGLFKCGECGRAITAAFKKGRYTYYHCTKSGGGAQSCRQPFVREETITEQLAEQIKSIELNPQEFGLLREILKESHAEEQKFRDEQLGRLQRLKAEVQRKQDTLLDRLLDGTVTKEVYDVRSAALTEERRGIEVAIYGHEQANRSYFQQMENFLEIARNIHQVFVAGAPRRKREIVKLVAWNGVLTDKNARLNLKRPCAVLATRPSIPYGVPDLAAIRTALLNDPIPLEVVKDLLGNAA